jgi:hypothetical protein
MDLLCNTGVTNTNITKTAWFSNQNKSKGIPSSKFKSWNKKNKNKNMIIVNKKSNKILLQRINENCEQKSNKILLQRINENWTRLW